MTNKAWVFLIISVLPFAAWSCGGETGQTAPAKTPDEDTLEKPGSRSAGSLELEARYPEGFSFLNGIRELQDGTVLVADPLAQLLLRIDLDRGTADTLGRAGPGPQEYGQPDRVFPLPGDSSLLVDLGKMQLTLITPEGELAPGLSMSLSRGESFPMVLQPRFVDETGRLYDQAARSRERGPPDSAAVIRFDRAADVLDTVATVWLPPLRQTRSRGGGFLPRMLEPADAWAVGPEGRIAVVRAEDFSVEWTLPDGRRLKGPPHSFPSYPADRGDKEAVLSELRSSGITMVAAASRDGSVQRMSMSRGLPNSGAAPGVDDFEWAEVFPPFRPEGAVISAEGTLWVERWLPADSQSRWECFDGEGVWTGSVVLPPRHRLLAFGRGQGDDEVAYLTYTDEYDLMWLERYGVVW